MTEFTLDVHPNKCQLFKAWYLFFFFFLNYRRFVHHQIQNKNWLQKQLNTLFRSCLAFRSCQSPYQQLCMSFHSSFVWQAALSSEVQNQSFKEVSAMFFFVFFFFILLSLLFSRLQEILVDFWFQKSWVTVVFHQAIYQFLRPVEAIWPRLRDIFTDFFSGHRVNVYLGSENSSFYFTLSFWIYFYIMCLTVKDKLFSTE